MTSAAQPKGLFDGAIFFLRNSWHLTLGLVSQLFMDGLMGAFASSPITCEALRALDSMTLKRASASSLPPTLSLWHFGTPAGSPVTSSLLPTLKTGTRRCRKGSYKSATFTCATERKIVEDYKAAHKIDDNTIKGWIQEESEYLRTLTSEPEYDVDAARYVELLDALGKADDKLGDVDDDWIISTPNNPNLRLQGNSGTAKLETRRRNAFEQRQNLLFEIEQVELRMGVGQRWTADAPEYKAASAYILIRDYRKALDRVEFLIVQRLLNLRNSTCLEPDTSFDGTLARP